MVCFNDKCFLFRFLGLILIVCQAKYTCIKNGKKKNLLTQRGSIISTSEEIYSKGTVLSTLAATAVTAAYATSAGDPLLGNGECLYCDLSWIKLYPY